MSSDGCQDARFCVRVTIRWREKPMISVSLWPGARQNNRRFLIRPSQKINVKPAVVVNDICSFLFSRNESSMGNSSDFEVVLKWLSNISG